MDQYSPQGDSRALSAVIEEHAFSLIAETCLYSLYTFLIGYLVCRPYVTRKATSLPPFMLPFTLLMFALLSVYCALDIHLLWTEYHILLSRLMGSPHEPTTQDMHGELVPYLGEDGLSLRYLTPVYVQYISQLLLIVLGDFVSLWRTYVIYGRPRRLFILLACIAATESVMYVLIIASASPEYLPFSSPGSVMALARAKLPITVIGYSITALAQFVSTLLIAHKAWVHFRDVRAFVHQSTTRRTVSTLVIIIESGIAYVALLFWYAAIAYFGTPGSIAIYTCRFYSVPLIAMYPTLLIVIVATHRSVLERSIRSVGRSDDLPTLAGPRRPTHPVPSSPLNRNTGERETQCIEIGFRRSMRLAGIGSVLEDKGEEQRMHDEEAIAVLVKPCRAL